MFCLIMEQASGLLSTKVAEPCLAAQGLQAKGSGSCKKIQHPCLGLFVWDMMLKIDSLTRF